MPPIHSDLIYITKEIYQPLGIISHSVTPESESAEYGAEHAIISDKRVMLRVAKITPTKAGQFVTFWKRIGNGPIIPYDIDDAFNLLIISVRKDNQQGQFIFPKSVLLEKGLLSRNEIDGKRALRLYPAWDIPESKQVQTTQQ